MGVVFKVKSFIVLWMFILVYFLFSSVVYAESSYSLIEPELDLWDQEILNVHKEYFLLSSDVYGFEGVLENNPQAVIEGRTIVHSESKWKVLNYTDDGKFSGFTAATFQNEETGIIVVAYGGTSAGENDALDIIADVGIVDVDGRSPQFVEALTYIQQTQKDHPDAIIELTGHSLGGGLAAWASLKTGLTAVTINPAPVTVSKHAHGLLGPVGRNTLANRDQQGNITNIRSVEDPVSGARVILDNLGYNTSPGETITLDSWRGSVAAPPTTSGLFYRTKANLIEAGSKYISAHQLSPILKNAFPEESAVIVFEDTQQTTNGAKAGDSSKKKTATGAGSSAITPLPTLHERPGLVRPGEVHRPTLHQRPKLYSPK